jgi:hypothetical protein
MSFPSAPTREHQWLQRLVGDWTMQADCNMGPDKPAERTEGKESVRAIGGLWVLGEGEAAMPGGGTATNLITLGYDAQKARFVGSFVSSCMDSIWQYEGRLDEDGRVLTLDTEGPDFGHPGQTARYQDIIELTEDGRRLMSSRMQGSDGAWHTVMSAEYRRRG